MKSKLSKRGQIIPARKGGNQDENDIILNAGYIERDFGNTARIIQLRKGSKEEAEFDMYRKDEIEGLMNDETFVPIGEEKLKPGTRVFG